MMSVGNAGRLTVSFLVFGLAPLVVGCGARTEVAKEKILGQVDRLLGTIDVKKKEAQLAVQGMEAGIDKIKMGRIESRMRLTQVTDNLTVVNAKIAQADKALGRLRDGLKEGKETVFNEKTYSSTELKGMADQIINARKKLFVEAEGLKSIQKRLSGIVTALEQREQDGRERLAKIKQSVDEIDAKAVALRSIQEAASLSGDTEVADFTAVEKQVRDLSGKIDVELAFNDEKVKEHSAESKSLESIVRVTSTAGDTVSEIDKILGSN
jgi:chromosome segregation ATPase